MALMTIATTVCYCVDGGECGKSESRTMETKGPVTCTLSLIGNFFASSAFLGTFLFPHVLRDLFFTQLPSSPFSPSPSPLSTHRFRIDSQKRPNPTLQKHISSCLTAVATRAEATPIGKLLLSTPIPRSRVACALHLCFISHGLD